MAITKGLDISAVASATSVIVRQRNQQNAANLRPEKIVVLGQAQTGSKAKTNELVLASGSADDIGTIFGYGSPLHRMALKLFPKAGNGSKVETYFVAVAEPKTSSAEVKTLAITASNGILKSLNGYFVLNDLTFEAAADVAGKIATSYHNNPAQDVRGTDLNIYEKTAIPFTFAKGMTVADCCNALKEVLDEYLELPFTVALNQTDSTPTGLILTAKWKGSDSVFDFKLVDEDYNDIDSTVYGCSFEITRTTESAGVGTYGDVVLDLMSEELGVTRVVSQYATSTVLDELQEKFEAWRNDGLIAQYVLCYSAIQAPESEDVAGTWDTASLISTGTARRDDGVNVQIVGDARNLRPLKYKERDTLLKAGYSNIVKKSDGSYRLMDLATFYHPVGKTNPLFRFDRDVTVVANICYDFMARFRDSDEWKSVILIGENDITTNPAARTLKDVKAAVNTEISLLGVAALIANYAEAQKNTQVEIDSNNPNRVNINPVFDITGTGRIFDIVNSIGFNFKG